MTQAAVKRPAGKAIPDLSNEATRAELTPAAIDGFLRLSTIWRLTAKQSIILLGEGSERTWFRIKAGEWEHPLSQDSLTRVSALVGVYKGLHLLFSDPLADEWVRRPNTGELFEGVTPLDYMLAGGIPAMIETRAFIDALRGGL
ncbi:antitoxin Xre/MbcA/ParS toxin-binding domain-containing protein [Bradyrhizobium sp. 177]|uniref:antitoxin Xre/MbcA/ParS toxin-binding domain-containing protein n=1 Tax=Bradyrhizobium sp. 177 TaxID=2782647 RepID=UPI001FFB180B|nr:antitoxin Xre/MbcA/ParS toxin-binding domain-containing protein [Bradyrhizobium sp. 177]